MNQLLEEYRKLETVSPICVESPFYISELPHRFGKYFGPYGDGFQTSSVALYGEWAAEESYLLESLIKPGDWVLDCGANCGSLTLAFASRVGPKGRVFAFEPQLIPSQCLTANVVANSLSLFVFPMRLALGKEKGEIACPVLNPRQLMNSGGVSLVDPPGSNPTETVPMLSIDDLSLLACNLIKVDVEGMEPDVLQGAFQTITKFRPIIWTEQLDHREGSREDLLKIFAEHNYKSWKVFTWLYSPRNLRNCQVNPFRVEKDNVQMWDTNVLAIPQEMDPPPWIEKPEFYGNVEEFK